MARLELVLERDDELVAANKVVLEATDGNVELVDLGLEATNSVQVVDSGHSGVRRKKNGEDEGWVWEAGFKEWLLGELIPGCQRGGESGGERVSAMSKCGAHGVAGQDSATGHHQIDARRRGGRKRRPGESHLLGVVAYVLLEADTLVLVVWVDVDVDPVEVGGRGQPELGAQLGVSG